jgi:hypothetical protein
VGDGETARPTRSASHVMRCYEVCDHC